MRATLIHYLTQRSSYTVAGENAATWRPALNLLVQVTREVHHWNDVAIGHDIEHFCVDRILGKFRLKGVSRDKSIRPTEPNGRYSRLCACNYCNPAAFCIKEQTLMDER